MKYTVLSIDESRAKKKAAIHAAMTVPHLPVEAVSYREHDLHAFLAYHGVTVDPLYKVKVGELGVWFSQARCWETVADMDEPLIVFEDDAMVNDNFDEVLGHVMEDLPANWHTMSLFVPDNQRKDYYYNVKYNDKGVPGVIRGNLPWDKSIHYIGSQWVSKAYQGYSCVCTMYSPRGGAQLLKRMKETNIYTPVDCFIFLETHRNQLNGYALQPLVNPMPVWYAWRTDPTLVHSTRLFK